MEPRRDRVLTDDELVAIWNACRNDDHGRIVRLLLLTGQRRDEVGAMARSEVDRARKWTLSGLRTKNNRPHEVPLSDAAIAILTPAIERAESLDRDLVFGERATGFKGWGKAKLALDRRIAAAKNDADQKQPKAKPWRLHDLRRSAATKMAEIGIQPHIIEAVLNHVSGHKAGVAGVYNLASYSPEKRRALDLWAAHIEALLEGKPASNISSLRREA